MIAEETLQPLGFTEIEALAYCHLLRSGPATGYRLAQDIQKAQANTYKALSTLSHKGAVIEDGGEPRIYRAVAPQAMIDSLRRRHAEQTERAEKLLSDLEQPAEQDRLYQLKNVDQVMDHARRLINTARESLLFDLWPTLETLLKPELEAAVARGVTLAGITYKDEFSLNCLQVQTRTRDAVLANWPGVQMILVADAREHMTALLEHSMATVRHAVWSDSNYLSSLQHYALSAEIRLLSLPPEEEDVPRILSLGGELPPGVRELIGKTACSSPDTNPAKTLIGA